MPPPGRRASCCARPPVSTSCRPIASRRVSSSELPDATYLALGFASNGRPSRGTLKTSIENLSRGGRIRSAGRITAVAHAFRERDIDFGEGVRSAVTIPWGDVSTAYWTTGIENIECYIAMPADSIAKLKRLNTFGGLLRFGPVQGC